MYMFGKFSGYTKMELPKSFKILTFFDSLWYFTSYLLAPMMAIFINKFGSLEDVGVSYAIISISSALASLFSDEIVGKYNLGKTILIVNFLSAIRILFYTKVGSLWDIFILQFIGGVLSAIEYPASRTLMTIIADKKVSNKHLTEQYGAYNFYVSLTSALGAIISGYIVTAHGYNFLFIVFAVSHIIYGTGIYFTMREANIMLEQ